MRHRISWTDQLWVGLVVLCVLQPGGAEAQLRVITANPPEAGVHELAESFSRISGQAVAVEAMGTAAMTGFLEGTDPADVLVGTADIVRGAGEAGRILGTPVSVGRVGIGVIVPVGAEPPDVSRALDFRSAVLAADTIVFNTAGSGRYVESMLEMLGVADAIRARSERPSNAAETVRSVVGGRGRVVGFGLVSEMAPYDGTEIRLVGRLPDALQNYTSYDGAVLARSESEQRATEFLRYLTTPQAREVFRRHGVD